MCHCGDYLVHEWPKRLQLSPQLMPAESEDCCALFRATTGPQCSKSPATRYMCPFHASDLLHCGPVVPVKNAQPSPL